MDSDNDGDGVADGMEITAGFDPADSADNPASVYEDAEDSHTLRWRIYDDSPAGAAVANIDDSQRQSRVIETRGDGIANAYRLLLENGAPWGNTGQFVLRWSMRYPQGAYLYVDVETTAGHRFLQYAPIDDSPLGAGEYIVHGIGSAVYTQGSWQTYARDLQEDLQIAQPGVRIPPGSTASSFAAAGG